MTYDLSKLDPGDTGTFKDKSEAQEKLAADIRRLSKLQDIFAASKVRALLVILQGMDSAGKDGAIKHVMSGLNPQGVHVNSFKVPTDVELAHDYLWRYERALPERGRFGIFNRSYYEEVLVVRVHRELLARERGEEEPARHTWQERFEDINAFERHLTRNGTVIVKIFLNISKDEQRKRLLARVNDPEKTWKLSENDVKERKYWDRYQEAYQSMLDHTSTPWAPWHVIASDHKWYMRTSIAGVLVSTLESLNLRYPVLEDAEQASLSRIREQLEADTLA